MESEFLDFYTRGNSKTFYYLRIMAYHGIPLIVHNLNYKKVLEKQCREHWKDRIKPLIYHVQDKDLYYRIRSERVIVDDPIVFRNDNDLILHHIDYLSTDEIRDIILTDLAEGYWWRYR